MTRQCWFQPRLKPIVNRDHPAGYWEEQPWQPGTLLEWSIDFEELRDGVGQFPVAIISDDSGKVHIVHAESVNFGKEKPT